MKPLELHIYEKHPEADAYRVGGFYSPYCLVSRDKRFSEAELAAEWWRQRDLYIIASKRVDTLGLEAEVIESREQEWRRLSALDRLLAAPHYDEADQ